MALFFYDPYRNVPILRKRRPLGKCRRNKVAPRANPVGSHRNPYGKHTAKKHRTIPVLFLLVTRTGFEPMSACVKGMCVNHFTNGPYFVSTEVFLLVTRTGFEPMSACVKGMCVNHFTNGPCGKKNFRIYKW